MKITLPERGQPIDLNYMYQLANAINDLNNQIVSTKATSIINNGIDLVESVTTNNIRFYAGTVNITSGSVNANTSRTWALDFTPPFLYTPVVTATVQNNTSSTAGNNLILVMKNISANRVDGNILYKEKGSIDININVIAMGISR